MSSYNPVKPKKEAEAKLTGNQTPKSETQLNTHRMIDRSGNEIEMCFEEGNEFMRVTHRTGAGVCINPDGSVKLVSQNGKMEFIINGEGMIKVSGKYDLVVDGDATIKCQKAYWSAKNLEVNIDENTTFNSKSINLNASDKMDIVAKNFDAKVAENANMTAGSEFKLAGDSSMNIGSTSGNMIAKAKTTVKVESGTSMETNAGSTMEVKSGSTMDLNAGGNMTASAPRIDLN
jgi:hypothetical protein